MTTEEITANLNVIREAIDADVFEADINSVLGKLHRLTCLFGLSAECNSNAKANLHKKELEVIRTIDRSLPASVQTKTLNAECWEESALLEYADRLNAGLTHALEALRSMISLYKTELQNSLIQDGNRK